jgi:hypothetical protein
MKTKTTILASALLLSSFCPLFGSGHIANLGTRAFVATGDAVLINEFVIQGTTSKSVLLRARGSSLGAPGALPDPTMSLYAADGTLIVRNDDWQQAANQQAISNTGLAPTDPKEPAILHTLAPGTYTAIVKGVNGTTGLAMSEIYDMNQGSSTSTLTAIGSRAEVGTADNAMISGFSLSGGNQDLLVRALGKSLAGAGIPAALLDPTIDIYDSNGAHILTNDNWKSSQQAMIQNSGLAPSNLYEAALIHSFVPGNYTIVTRGLNNSTGIGFMQTYLLPYNGQPLDPTPAPPIRFETESLTAAAQSSSSTHTVISDTHLSGGAGTLLSNNMVGSFVTYSVVVPKAGTYDVQVRMKTGSTRGKFQLSINGTNLGPVQDEYTNAIQYTEVDLGQRNFATAGTKSFTFTVTGRNVNSGGNTLAFDAIDLTP